MINDAVHLQGFPEVEFQRIDVAEGSESELNRAFQDGTSVHIRFYRQCDMSDIDAVIDGTFGITGLMHGISAHFLLCKAFQNRLALQFKHKTHQKQYRCKSKHNFK